MGKKHFFPTFLFCILVILVFIPAQMAFSWTKGCNCSCECRFGCYLTCSYAHKKTGMKTEKSFYHNPGTTYKLSVDGKKSCFFSCGECKPDTAGLNKAKDLCEQRFVKSVCGQWAQTVSCPDFADFTLTNSKSGSVSLQVKCCGLDSFW